MVMNQLSERDTQMLDFENQYWRFVGAKERAIRQRFDLTPTQYYVLLNELIDRPEALAAKPLLIRRLRAQRETRQARRGMRPQ